MSMMYKEKEISQRLFVSVFVAWQFGLMIECARDNYATYVAVTFPFVTFDFGFKRSEKKIKSKYDVTNSADILASGKSLIQKGIDECDSEIVASGVALTALGNATKAKEVLKRMETGEVPRQPLP